MNFSNLLAAAIGITLGICFLAYVLGALALLFFLRDRTFSRFFPLLSLVSWIPVSLLSPHPSYPTSFLEWITTLFVILWFAFGIVGNFILLFRRRFWFQRAVGAAGLLLFLCPIALFLDGLLVHYFG